MLYNTTSSLLVVFSKGPVILHFLRFVPSRAQPHPHSFQSILNHGCARTDELDACTVPYSLLDSLCLNVATTASARSQKLGCTQAMCVDIRRQFWWWKLHHEERWPKYTLGSRQASPLLTLGYLDKAQWRFIWWLVH